MATSTVFSRQNDKNGIKLLKAVYFCLKSKNRIIYFTITLSVISCFAGIANCYLQLYGRFLGLTNLAELQVRNAVIINLAAGLMVILSIILKRMAHLRNLYGVNLMERYDAYVFDLPLNTAFMRPVSDAQIEIFARKVRRKADHFVNFYFSSAEEANQKNSCYRNLDRMFNDEFRLMLGVQPFFLTLWVIFALTLFVFSVSFNDDFISTLTNVLFPSLSIIGLICSSWFGFSDQLRRLQNCLGILAAINASSSSLSNQTNILTLRNLQDGIYNIRMKSITMPGFLVARHEKKMAREDWGTTKTTRDLVGKPVRPSASSTRKQTRGKSKGKGGGELDSHLLEINPLEQTPSSKRKTDPPKSDPPKSDPPKTDPPKADSPKSPSRRKKPPKDDPK